jgi:glutamate-1-semialdehyde 2,1-aminomutase
MDIEQPTNSAIVAAYRARTPGSAGMAEEARRLLPSGIAHDARHLDPYGLYVERALGPHKWDVDGNRYIDYYGGHGSLILGHGNAVVNAAVAEALAEGTHFAANHPREIAWAKAVQRLVPSAERIRFTSSGTEATLMAVRLARAFTGREGLIRFKGHFHGWHDQMTSGYSNHYDASPTPGVMESVAHSNVLLHPWDIDAVASTLAERKDIAAVILEPTGSSFGQVPIRPEFLRALRELTAKHGVLLIMDEVITGFRVSAGGAQGRFGVRPDLSTFAKILAGGLPGGAVCGRQDILELLDFEAMKQKGREKIGHPGTYNANPVSAASGIACLTQLAESDAAERAEATAARLRDRCNEVFRKCRVNWAMYGTSSGFHMCLSAPKPGEFDPFTSSVEALKTMPEKLVGRLRLALLVHGVDTGGRIGGFLSCTHTEADVDDTAAAFDAAIGMLREEGEIA